MIRRRTPFGYRTCTLCGSKMIRGSDIACAMCLREMTEDEISSWSHEFWNHRFIVPMRPKVDASTKNAAGREFMTQVNYSTPDIRLTTEPIEVIVLTVTEAHADALQVGELVVEALTESVIMYRDQVRILETAVQKGAPMRVEVTVRRLHEDEIRG